MEWLIGKRRSRGEGRSSRSTRRSVRRALNVWVLVVVALATVAFVSAATGSPISAARADNPTLNITVPHPADKHTEGPVGTNITVHAQGLNAGDTYALGYARADVGCLAGFQAFQNETETMTEKVGTDGTFTATIAWPASAHFIGATYYICAQNSTPAGAPLAGTVQSDETFRVDAANAPAIDVAPSASATPGDGTASPAPPNGSFYQHSTLTLTGHNFVPGGTTLLIAVSAQRLQQPADFQAAAQNALQTSDGNQNINSQPSGDINATVTLPANLGHGSYYVYVFSNDGGDQAIPSLVASKKITVVTAPTPQPTATTAPTATATGKSSGGGGSGTPHHFTAVLVLGGLSILLFIVGVIALLSAAAMPGPSRS